MKLVDRFLSYTKFDTQSAEDSQTVPSTPKQLIFAKYLKEELENEGLADVEMDEMGAHILLPIVVKGGIFPIELVKIGNELNATVAVCHDDITEQMAVIISWG